MLQNLRDRMTGPFVWVIVGIIVVPFAFFGIETLRTGGGDPAVIKVNGQKITESQVRRGTDQRVQQLQQLMGDNFRQDLIDTQRFRQAVLDDMTQELVLRQHAENEGYRVSNAALFETIASVPAFQDQGKFSTEAYRARLSQMGSNVQRFESQLRDSLVIDQLREGILASSFVTDAESRQAYRLDQQQREATYAVFDSARYLSQVKVSDEDILARYEQAKSSFLSPERIQLQYIELALSELPDSPAPSADVLRAVYESDKASRFSTPEERRARHILVNFGADREASRKKILGLAELIAKGSEFASLASSQSDDPGSKSKGGDLGWIKRGQMLEKFEAALFTLQPGQVSAPVETEFGWHLIKLDELRPPDVKPFENGQVQGELMRLYQQRDSERRYREMSEKLEQLAFESPATLEPVAKALELPLKNSGWITRGEAQGLFSNQVIRDTAFSTDVMANENSKPVPAGDNRVVVMRKLAYEAPRQKPVDEVREAIRGALLVEAANARAQAEAAEVLKALQDGRPAATLAREKGIEFKSPGMLLRSASQVDGVVLRELFRLPRPKDGESRWATVKMANGNTAVLGLSKVVDGDMAAAAAGARSAQGAQLREGAAGAQFGAFRADLQRRGKIERYEQAPVAAPDAGDDASSDPNS